MQINFLSDAKTPEMVASPAPDLFILFLNLAKSEFGIYTNANKKILLQNDRVLALKSLKNDTVLEAKTQKKYRKIKSLKPERSE